jgi:hypothetical protein
VSTVRPRFPFFSLLIVRDLGVLPVSSGLALCLAASAALLMEFLSLLVWGVGPSFLVTHLSRGPVLRAGKAISHCASRGFRFVGGSPM